MKIVYQMFRTKSIVKRTATLVIWGIPKHRTRKAPEVLNLFQMILFRRWSLADIAATIERFLSIHHTDFAYLCLFVSRGIFCFTLKPAIEEGILNLILNI